MNKTKEEKENRVGGYVFIAVGLLLIYFFQKSIPALVGIGFVLLGLFLLSGTKATVQDPGLFGVRRRYYTTHFRTRCPRCPKVAQMNLGGTYLFSNGDIQCEACGFKKEAALGFLDKLIFFSVALILPAFIFLFSLPMLGRLNFLGGVFVFIVFVVLFWWKLPLQYAKSTILRKAQGANNQ